VSDDGAGSDPDAVERAQGIGVRAVRQRLETRYGSAGRLAVKTSPGAGFAVTVSLPARAEAREAPRATVPAQVS
jgi:signal transduction histidine kinase